MSYQSIARDDEEPSRWRPSNNSRYQAVPDSEASPSTRHKRQQSSRTKRAATSNRRSSRRPDSQASDASDGMVAPLRIIKSRSSELQATDQPSANQSTHPAGYHAIEPEEDPTVRFDEAQLAMFAADNASRMPNIKDELALAAGKVTPGVDDTPYIQYALQALVGGQSTSIPSHLVSNSSDGYSERYEPMRGFDESAGYSSPTRQDRITSEAAPSAPPQGPFSPLSSSLDAAQLPLTQPEQPHHDGFPFQAICYWILTPRAERICHSLPNRKFYGHSQCCSWLY
ncbi:uncharacterized protein TrAtP1_012416 [Trichoderma atroviride]|uniref:uncharacterized protein n=1 Tax=Hypocrea atroviridis TaxID=63577 RepID=UPI00331C5ADC|nr:hypothetical protein TrAtP1_012416 [Trichoderma atroviride]